LGASPVRAFFRIVLPLSLPVLLVAVLIRAIETFKIFDVSINSVAWLCFTSKLEALLDVESNSFYAGV
jgi:ABC-type glycerol-3-phosphate transport system permease component